MSNILRLCMLGSGSGGNSLVIEYNNASIMIDAGFSCKSLLERLQQRQFRTSGLVSVLLTHEHDDHIKGGRVFCNKLNVPLCLSARTAAALHPKGKLPDKILCFEPGNCFEMHPFTVHPFSVQHDACDPVGFVIECGRFRIGVATDLGQVNMLARRHLSGCDALILESNYDLQMLMDSPRQLHLKRRIMGKHGHMDNLDAADALETLLSERTHYLALAHVSSECNSRSIVYQTVAGKLAAINRSDVHFEVLEQHTPSEVFIMEE